MSPWLFNLLMDNMVREAMETFVHGRSLDGIDYFSKFIEFV